MTTVIDHWVSGHRTQRIGQETGPDAAPARTLPVTNPATGAVTGQVPMASAADVAVVVESARKAFDQWRETSVARRTQVLFAFRELVAARAAELAEIVTAEHGKVHADAQGEVARGLDIVDFACGIGHLLKGSYTESASTQVDVHSIRQPLGVAAVISPFNFPAMVPLWFVPLALGAGNAVVLKPSEKDPSASVWMAERWAEAGLPPGVLSVVHGDKEAVDALLTHPGVDSVSFVGSTPIARYVYETGTAHGKRVQALGGAKNHMLVLPDADIEQAADAAVSAGFGSAGERCMAISALVAVEPVGDDLVKAITARIAKLRVGDGAPGEAGAVDGAGVAGPPDMGPLVTREHRDRVAGYVQAGVDAGAVAVVDGRDIKVPGREDGFWLGPTLFDHVRPDMTIYTDEIFGPVLSVLRVDSYTEGVELINSNPYGNGVAIFTRDGGAARRFAHEVNVGMVGVNVPIPVPVAYYSFGGWKASLFGDTHAHGVEGVHFFTRGKVVTTRWPDPSTGGVDLGFPTHR